MIRCVSRDLWLWVRGYLLDPTSTSLFLGFVHFCYIPPLFSPLSLLCVFVCVTKQFRVRNSAGPDIYLCMCLFVNLAEDEAINSWMWYFPYMYVQDNACGGEKLGNDIAYTHECVCMCVGWQTVDTYHDLTPSVGVNGGLDVAEGLSSIM